MTSDAATSRPRQRGRRPCTAADGVVRLLVHNLIYGMTEADVRALLAPVVPRFLAIPRRNGTAGGLAYVNVLERLGRTQLARMTAGSLRGSDWPSVPDDQCRWLEQNVVDVARRLVVCFVRCRGGAARGFACDRPATKGDGRCSQQDEGFFTMLAALALLAGTAAAQGAKPLKKCAPDAVIAGTVCMDTWEASVWRVPDPLVTNKSLVKKIQDGKATAALLAAGGAAQLGLGGQAPNYAPCADSGQNCTDDIYAVSLPGVLPSANLTWFQAQAACENARKRLPSNAEWQAAVAGTPDPGGDDETDDCNTSGPPFAATATGSRSSCKSARGAFDMVGNLNEWVADWVPRSTTCGTWSAGVSPTGDFQCLAGAATTGEPGALLRGGDFLISGGAGAGPLSVDGEVGPSAANVLIGFRCAR